MHWLQLTEDGSWTWTDKVIINHYIPMNPAITVKYCISCWTLSPGSVQTYSPQLPDLRCPVTVSRFCSKHLGSGELRLSLCGHRAKVKNP